jgi:hypothetical protein
VAAVTSRPTGHSSDSSDRAEAGRDHRLVLVVGAGAAMGSVVIIVALIGGLLFLLAKSQQPKI